jgi:hypothetical protein
MTMESQISDEDEELTSSQSTPAPANAASPELTAGTGFAFEDSVVAVYAAALLAETTAAGLSGRIVKRLALQQGALGHPLDDVVVEGQGPDESQMRLSLQVKRKLVISSAATNSDFRETVLRAFSTVNGKGFQPGLDRVGAVVNEIADGSKRTFETLCEWARADSDVTSFVAKLNTEGFAGEKRDHFNAVRAILADTLPDAELDAVAHRLLAHFVLMRFDLLHEGATTEAAAVASLSNCLVPSDRPRADDLWRRLLALVRVRGGQAASLDRKTLVATLNGAFRLDGAPSLRVALSQVTNESRLAAAEIVNTIAGLSIPRDRFVQAARDALTRGPFVQIGGLPGTGKSVVLKFLVEETLANGPALFLKADRLSGATWAQYATGTGIGSAPLEELLVELAALGSSTIFIDGIDRIEVRNRGVLLDLFDTLLNSPHLACWRVIVTVRDTGMEPVRTWLPDRLFVRGVKLIDVDGFDDVEADLLAEKKPALRPLLFGSEQVQAIVRRPFFAGVLIKRYAGDPKVPSSEVELATAWWVGGGYGAEAVRAGHRRAALVQLAQAGAVQLGRRIPALEMDAHALAELEADGIIRPVRSGQTVRFVHDIYFEWAFLQLLVSKNDRWIDVIRDVGEPPVLGRVVELLSQAELTDGEDWPQRLAQLEATPQIRSQWMRAWILGPFGLPTFRVHEGTYSPALLADEAKRVAKLAVWFQAEKTKANPIPLDTQAFPDMDLVQRLVAADALAYPSDFDAWRRFCNWLFRHIEEIPAPIRPDLVAAFEVWQNAVADLANPVSGAILGLAKGWLQDIEARLHGGDFPRDYGPWEQLERERLEELESQLRALLLRAGRAYPTLVREYLSTLQAKKRLPRSAVKEVLLYSPVLSEVCPGQLVDFALHVMLRPLPEEVVRRASRSRFGNGISSHDWRSLSIDDQHAFFPCAPTREPFPSLFARAPDEARRLVRDLTNHAIEAWRQMHRFDYERRGTPIPLTLRFPWGQQTFWGDVQEYMWSRGTWGPHVVASGLMALETWAFKEIEKGRAADDVLRNVIEGHCSAGALGVAAALALESQLCSETTLPLVASQRLWVWDIRRNVTELGKGSSLIGFRPPDRAHYAAVVKANERQCRRAELRWLASLFILRGGDLGARASAAITAFPDELPFDYEEEKQNAETVSELQRTAVIWAEIGKRENYRARPVEDKSGVLIEMDNPKAKGPDIDALNQRQAEMVEHHGLLHWVEQFFEKNLVAEEPTLSQAIDNARRIDSPSLFEERPSHLSPAYRRQGAVAGVAAVALCRGQGAETDLEWAADVCHRAWRAEEAEDEFFGRESILLFSPVLYAARGLAALLRHESEQPDAQRALLALAAHPYEQVATAALGAMLGVWDLRPDIAWLALDLAISLSAFEHLPYDATREQRQERDKRRLDDAVQAALTRAGTAEEPRALPAIPPAWVRAARGPSVRKGRRGKEVAVEWEHPPSDLETDFLAKILASIPVRAAMADVPRRDLFLSWCDGLVAWTIERLCPSWSRPPGAVPFEAESTELYEWRHALFRFLAGVSLHLEPADAARRFVEPVVNCDDETFGSLAESFVSHLTCSFMDETSLSRAPLALLERIVPRIVSSDSWRRAEWHDGSLNDPELSQMIRSLFFVAVEKAMGAARFANGDWRDVAAVLPLTDPILAAHGESPTVVSAFATRCERAFEAYPIDRFVPQLPMILGRTDGLPAGWRQFTLAARLAGLIQRFSERTQPLPPELARGLLSALDALVDMGDRRAAAVQTSEVFKDVRRA